MATTGQRDWQGPPWKSLLMHRHERGPGLDMGDRVGQLKQSVVSVAVKCSHKARQRERGRKKERGR